MSRVGLFHSPILHLVPETLLCTLLPGTETGRVKVVWNPGLPTVAGDGQ